MSSTNTSYKPGDVVNGYVLTEQGWVPTAITPAHAAHAPQAPKAKKPIYKRWWAIGLAAVFVIGAISMATGGGESTTSTTNATIQKDAAETAPKSEKATAPKLTPGQKNAVRSAENYLQSMPFSRAGLIKQLSSDVGDGYSVKDATYAVNHVKVNWNEQAAKAAKNYLDTMPFSRAALIKQLSSPSGDHYTHAQAVYGVNQAGL